jgi:hypothetical protein
VQRAVKRPVRRPLKRPVRWQGVLAGLSIGAALVAVLLAGCAGEHPKLPDAAAQKKANTELISQLEALPGAKVTATIESSLDGGQGNVGADAQLPADATDAQLDAVGDSIERTIWLSHVYPLGRININFTRVGSSVRVLQRVYIGSAKEKLGDKYGARPDGRPDAG